MISFFLALVIAGLLAVSLGTFKFSEYVTSEKDRWGDMVEIPSASRIVKRVLPVIIVFLAVLAFNPIEVQRIDAGSVGLKIDKVGNDKGIPVARSCKGYVWYNTWTTDVVEYSIRQFHIEYAQFQVAAKGGTLVPVKPSYNLYLKPEKATDVYIHLLRGEDLESLKNKWLATATTIALKNVTNRFSPDSIFNHASSYQQAVEQELNTQLSAYFKVDQINPGQQPPESMTGILQAKANAVQAAQQAELDRQTAVANAETKIANARGDSAQAVISAAGRAEAIRKEQAVITPTYVDYVKWANASEDVPRVPSTILGGSASVLLNR
jgi:hypothetical protein